MKVVALCFFAVFYLVFSVACAPQGAQNFSAGETTREDDRENKKVSANRILIPLELKSVQQFEDRMPIATEDGRAVKPRLITTIQFEAETCAGVTDHQFNVEIARRGGRSVLARVTLEMPNCDAFVKKAFRVASQDIQAGEAVVIGNPVRIELLAGTD